MGQNWQNWTKLITAILLIKLWHVICQYRGFWGQGIHFCTQNYHFLNVLCSTVLYSTEKVYFFTKLLNTGMLYVYSIGVYRVGQMAATHPPKVSHPFFIFAPRCRGGCKKIVFLHLFIPMILPRSYLMMWYKKLMLSYHFLFH